MQTTSISNYLYTLLSCFKRSTYKPCSFSHLVYINTLFAWFADNTICSIQAFRRLYTAHHNMSRLFLLSVTALLFTLCFRLSFENRSGRGHVNNCSNPYDSPQCRRVGQICCHGVCNTTCAGKRCRWDFQCSSRRLGQKCCAGSCQASCEGW